MFTNHIQPSTEDIEIFSCLAQITVQQARGVALLSLGEGSFAIMAWSADFLYAKWAWSVHSRRPSTSLKRRPDIAHVMSFFPPSTKKPG